MKALERGWITNRQIEAARVAMTRKIKRGGKVWINVFPDKPFTEKPPETRMGSGKGNPEGWVAVVKPGRVMFELAGVDRELAREAMTPRRPQAPDQDQGRKPQRGQAMRASDVHALSDQDLVEQLRVARAEGQFSLRFRPCHRRTENTAGLAVRAATSPALMTIARERGIDVTKELATNGRRREQDQTEETPDEAVEETAEDAPAPGAGRRGRARRGKSPVETEARYPPKSPQPRRLRLKKPLPRKRHPQPRRLRPRRLRPRERRRA